MEINDNIPAETVGEEQYHDRIAEAYEGLLGEDFMNRQKLRIDWICRRAGAGRIVDIGCSQGTVPLLLGRDGAEVTGIDIDPEAIRYAAGRLLEEPVEVQARVRYLCADFLSVDLREQAYDAVLMTEVLEHLEQPLLFLDKAARLLTSGGRLVVTVPFGVNAHMDHRRTYYLTELYAQLSALAVVTEIEFFDGWVGFLALKDAEGAVQVPLSLELVAREEQAFLGIEEKYRGIERGLRADLRRVREARQGFKDKVLDLSARLKEKKAAEETLLSRTESLNRELDARDAKLRETDGELIRVNRELDNLRSRLQDTEKTLQDTEKTLQDTEKDLRAAEQTAAAREDQIQRDQDQLRRRKEELRQAENREAQLKEKNGQYSSELYQNRRKLELADRERTELREKLDAVQRDYDELMDTPAGQRAKIRLVKAKLRHRNGASRADRRAYEGSLLRRIAKRVPFLVTIVKRIRMKHPDSEFLFLESSRSDFRRAAAESSRSAGAPRKPAPVRETDPAPVTRRPPEPDEPKGPAEKPQKAPPRVMTREQEQFVETLRPLIDALPESNGCRYYEKSSLRIGIICDEFFYDSINAAAEFVPLEPTDWREKLPGVDLLLVVSLWRGLHEEWKGVANINSVDRTKIDAVFDMIAESKRLGIPTVFYSKEDPPNYERFVEFAKECEYIFTTAEECLPDYVRDTGNPQPKVLRFSVNPLFHNPVGFRKFEKEKSVLFSGSWMAKYPERCKDMSMLFDGVLASGYGLHIFDRNYPANKNYLFPPEYFPYVSPSVDHATLQKVHKLFDWAINTNSVQFSKTMFANRAYELQAAGVLLLSNYSLGVNSLLPNVFMAFSSDEVRAILSAYTPEETYERQIAGIRSVLRSDTCFDRMDELYAAVGLERQQKVRRIAVIGDPGDPETAESFARQTFPDRELLAPTEVTEEALQDFDMVAFFGRGMRYGEFYLEDMANGFKYTACDYITKAAYLENGVLHPGTEHDYVGVMGSRFRTLFWREAFTAEALLGMADGTELPNGYSIDHFHYDAAPAAEKAARSEPYKLSVVVPVYNNGPHLYGKCFSSLRRSSIFRDMEIILVDDGSTDGVTPKYITDLAGRYDNVRTFFFEPGGSGSASRPRNKGVELATAEYLTFLDPDNEATEDGYARLLESMENGKYELAVGYHLRAGTAVDSMSRYSFIRERLGSDSFAENKPNVVRVLRFPTISIQAAVMRRGMVLENGFEQVPGAAGQDTLFGWQLLHGARSLRFLDLCVHVYYAATAGSVTNTLNIKYFRKLWLLQEPKLEWLRSAGLLEIFMKSKYAFYTDNLIFKNLARVNAGDGEEAVRIVWDYVQLYAPHFQGSDEMIGRFSALCERGDYSGALDYVKESFASPADAPESP